MTRYFVSFLFESPTGLTAGNCELNAKNPIRTWEDTQAVTAWLRDKGHYKPTLMSFSRLDGDTPERRETR